METINIAVIMTCHNRSKKTSKCISNIIDNKKSFNINLEIYLVLDGCTDNTKEIISNKFPTVHLIEGDGNLYWNRGMYTAWKYATKAYSYDFYLWLNDDTMLYKNSINTLLDTSQKFNYKAIVVGTICSIKEKSILTYGGRTDTIKNKIIFKEGSFLKCNTFNGNCVLIPQSVHKILGNLDPYFRHSFGDFEYGYRATKNKINIITSPQIVGECDRNEEVPEFLNKNYKIIQRLRYLYSPLGCNPIEMFYLDIKYLGLSYAILRFIKIHANILFFTHKK